MEFREIVGDRIFVVEGAMDEAVCWEVIERAEDAGYDMADVITNLGQGVAHSYRNNLRSIFDAPDLAQALMAEIAGFLPSAGGGVRPSGLNERFRVQYYREEEHFRPHIDGIFAREDGSEASALSLLVFLNDDFEGGQTRFHLEDGEIIDVEPLAGQALVFEHDVMHEGRPIISGEKYLLRTDVMYPA